MLVPMRSRLSVVPPGRIAGLMFDRSKLTLPARFGTLLDWTKMGRLKVQWPG